MAPNQIAYLKASFLKGHKIYHNIAGEYRLTPISAFGIHPMHIGKTIAYASHGGYVILEDANPEQFQVHVDITYFPKETP